MRLLKVFALVLAISSIFYTLVILFNPRTNAVFVRMVWKDSKTQDNHKKITVSMDFELDQIIISKTQVRMDFE